MNNDRPVYTDYDTSQKFQAIQGIIARRLREHPKAICSYSGGSDSDIMIDLIERVRHIFNLPPVKYVFFNTGLEMKATKDHVHETAEKYGVEIEEYRPKVGIVQAVRTYGLPFLSKDTSEKLSRWQQKNVSLSIAHEYDQSENKEEKYKELKERYPHCVQLINYLCGCDKSGLEGSSNIFTVRAYKYLLDFLNEYPPDFKISSKCCDYCKKKPAHEAQKGYDIIITGERKAEGGAGQADKLVVVLKNCQTVNIAYVLSTMYPTKTRRGIKRNTAYAIQMLMRYMALSVLAAVDAR